MKKFFTGISTMTMLAASLTPAFAQDVELNANERGTLVQLVQEKQRELRKREKELADMQDSLAALKKELAKEQREDDYASIQWRLGLLATTAWVIMKHYELRKPVDQHEQVILRSVMGWSGFLNMAVGTLTKMLSYEKIKELEKKASDSEVAIKTARAKTMEEQATLDGLMLNLLQGSSK